VRGDVLGFKARQVRAAKWNTGHNRCCNQGSNRRGRRPPNPVASVTLPACSGTLGSGLDCGGV
jgi:hypothetical protein